MRNPFRRKNLDLRFAPALVTGLVLIAISLPTALSVSIGAPLVAAGVAIRAWAAGHLVKTVHFTVTGPYGHLRHPLYLGTLSIGLGIALMLGGLPALIGAAALLVWFGLVYFPRKEQIESARLFAHYGEVYARYRDQVPALIPRARRWRPDPDFAEKVDTASRWRLDRFDANNEQGSVIAVGFAVALVWLRAGLA